jgi:cytochrome c556
MSALTAGAAIALGVCSLAIASTVEDRQAAMKAVAQLMKEASGLKSPATYNAAKAKAVMTSVATNARKLQKLYPPGGKDLKSAADPKIWRNKADFDKHLAEMASLASAASKTTTFDTYKPALAALGATCKSCHDLYRLKKSD